MRQLLREPLLHFFVLGAVLFAGYAWNNEDALRPPDDIVVDTTRIEALTSQFERVWRRAPTTNELQSLVDNWVREEVLYREGLALGLDRDDPVLRRRIAQKMDFISEELIEASPDASELQAWFADNADNYRLDPRFSFHQLYLDPSADGNEFEKRVEQVDRELASGKVPLGDATLLPATLEDATLSEVRRTFGEVFAESLQSLAVGEWSGPVPSGYGLHFVHVDALQASRLPELHEVRAAVERDYLAQRARELKGRFYDALRERYNVVYEDSVTLTHQLSGGGHAQ